jgi:hypothetical protein
MSPLQRIQLPWAGVPMQNFAECKIGDLKQLSSGIMDRASTLAASLWLLSRPSVVFTPVVLLFTRNLQTPFSDVWMKDCGTNYEHVCVSLNALAVMMKDPNYFFPWLKQRKHKKESVKHLTIMVAIICRDPNGTLTWGAKPCCKRVVNQCTSISGVLPKEFTSPVDQTDHPELNMTEAANPEEIKEQQALIGFFHGQSLLVPMTFSVQPCLWGDFAPPQKLATSSV